MAALTKDDVWKVIQMGLGILVIPLAGWVWNTNVLVAELKNDYNSSVGFGKLVGTFLTAGSDSLLGTMLGFGG